MKHNKRTGFTIIEIMIVLAIAGLIMVVVFMAVPALQRNVRNDGRKAAIRNAVTLMEEYRVRTRRYPNTTTFPDFKAEFEKTNPGYTIFNNLAGYGGVCNDYFHDQYATDAIAVTYPGAATEGVKYHLSIRLEGDQTFCLEY